MSDPKADSGFPIRARIVKEFGEDVPSSALALFEWINRPSGKRPQTLHFTVPALPPTVNHMYVTGRDKQGRPGARRLSMEALAFRETVGWIMAPLVKAWKPTGVVMAIVFIENPHWVTKRLTVRDMDLDNRLKSLFDAIEVATRIPDCTNWEIHCYKLASRKTQTTVYLVDLGDIIEWHK